MFVANKLEWFLTCVSKLVDSVSAATLSTLFMNGNLRVILSFVFGFFFLFPFCAYSVVSFGGSWSQNSRDFGVELNFTWFILLRSLRITLCLDGMIPLASELSASACSSSALFVHWIHIIRIQEPFEFNYFYTDQKLSRVLETLPLSISRGHEVNIVLYIFDANSSWGSLVW